jgi:hypothetical protein
MIRIHVLIKHLGSGIADKIMLKFKEYLKESLNNPYPFKWIKVAGDGFKALAKLNDGTDLIIRFDRYLSRWQIVFDRNDDYGVTGGGDAQRIFATVLSAISEFVKKHKPKSLEFAASKDVDANSANPESRAKLYNKLVQRYAKSMGYSVKQHDENDGLGPRVEYMLTKSKT